MAYESIPSPYRNIRGVNYLPTFPSINDNPPVGWAGITGPDIFWINFTTGTTSSEVTTQLSRLKSAGFNTVRVWLSYDPRTGFDSYSYVANTAAFITRVNTFVGLCHARELRVILVLFDSYTQSPDQTKLNTIMEDYANSIAHFFVADILSIRDTYSDAMFMLDIYNEPWVSAAPSAATVQPFIAAVADQIKTHSSDIVTMVGAASWTEAATSYPKTVADNNDIDVLSIHPYSTFPAMTEILMLEALEISASRKPVIATEHGSPGWGMLYRDSVEHCRKVKGAADQGIGFCLYQAMIGWADAASQFIHMFQSGMFFGNGKVRDVKEILAVRQAAVVAGITSGLYTVDEIEALQITTSDSYYVAQWPVPVGAGGKAWILDLLNSDPAVIDGMSSAERDSLAYALHYWSSYEIIGASVASVCPWKGKDTAPVIAVDLRFTITPGWAGMSDAEEILLLRDWIAAVAPFMPAPINPATRSNLLACS